MKGALELKESHVNVSYSARNNINLEVLKSPRKTGMIRSSSVPNLFTVAIKEGRKHDSKHDPRINSDKTLEVNPKTPQKTTKLCHWLTGDKTRKTLKKRILKKLSWIAKKCSREKLSQKVMDYVFTLLIRGKESAISYSLIIHEVTSQLNVQNSIT